MGNSGGQDQTSIYYTDSTRVRTCTIIKWVRGWRKYVEREGIWNVEGVNEDKKLDWGGREYRRARIVLVQSVLGHRHRHQRRGLENELNPLWSVDGLERTMVLPLTSIDANRRQKIGWTDLREEISPGDAHPSGRNWGSINQSHLNLYRHYIPSLFTE